MAQQAEDFGCPAHLPVAPASPGAVAGTPAPEPASGTPMAELKRELGVAMVATSSRGRALKVSPKAEEHGAPAAHSRACSRPYTYHDWTQQHAAPVLAFSAYASFNRRPGGAAVLLTSGMPPVPSPVVVQLPVETSLSPLSPRPRRRGVGAGMAR